MCLITNFRDYKEKNNYTHIYLTAFFHFGFPTIYPSIHYVAYSDVMPSAKLSIWSISCCHPRQHYPQRHQFLVHLQAYYLFLLHPSQGPSTDPWNTPLVVVLPIRKASFHHHLLPSNQQAIFGSNWTLQNALPKFMETISTAAWQNQSEGCWIKVNRGQSCRWSQKRSYSSWL